MFSGQPRVEKVTLTIGKKKYAAVEATMIEQKEEMDLLRKKLLFLVDQDACAFRPLAEAYRMPTETEEDRAKKAEIMEACLQDAAAVPLEIMRSCGEVIRRMRTFAEQGSRLALSDAGCGAALAKAALESAALNVFINTTSMKDRAFADATEHEAAALLDQYRPEADAIYRMVLTDILA